MVDVVEVLGHILFVLFKCNRVTNQALLGFAGFLAVGQLTVTQNLSEGTYSFCCFCKKCCSVLGVASGYGFGFICGIQLASPDFGPAALAIFLCLGESHFPTRYTRLF